MALIMSRQDRDQPTPLPPRSVDAWYQNTRHPRSPLIPLPPKLAPQRPVLLRDPRKQPRDDERRRKHTSRAKDRPGGAALAHALGDPRPGPVVQEQAQIREDGAGVPGVADARVRARGDQPVVARDARLECEISAQRAVAEEAEERAAGDEQAADDRWGGEAHAGEAAAEGEGANDQLRADGPRSGLCDYYGRLCDGCTPVKNLYMLSGHE